MTTPSERSSESRLSDVDMMSIGEGDESAWPEGDRIESSPRPVLRWRWWALASAAALLGWAAVVQPWNAPRRPPPEPSPSQTPTPSLHVTPLPVAAPPRAGSCHELTIAHYADSTDTAPPVSCRDTHVALTVSVVGARGVALPYDGDVAAMIRAGNICQAEVDRYTGLGPGVTFSLITSAVWEPTPEQLAGGQSWLRCDLVVMPPYSGLVPLESDLAGSMRAGPDPNLAFCVDPTAVEGPPALGTGRGPAANRWPTQVDCLTAGALVAIRPVDVAVPSALFSRAPAVASVSCSRLSRRFDGMPLRALLPTRDYWTEQALCTTDLSSYLAWVRAGKPLVR